jgi:hypothetical protein
MDMKIIRCLWGKPNHQFFERDLTFYHKECHLAKEVDEKYGLKNQMVIVWDEVNCELMEKLGYPYHYMGPSLEFNSEFNFYHKLLALKRATELYDEILFLDWDCYIQKPLDDNFYKLIRERGDIQIPLYFYPNEILRQYHLINPKANDTDHYFNMFFYQIIRKGKWYFDNGITIPNAGFIYLRDKNFPNKLIEIQKTYGILSNIEEVCSLIYFNDFINSTDEYLDLIEPVVCLGKTDFEMQGKQVLLNQYTIEKLKKDIYFIHE